ncbi:Na(+)/dicarboxylate cotransporter 3-like [Antedon mediterranea]|uniref:Na(+)/dicarboxylate cotransporter 3-like n=1 Tax=Antedon mediterranea TaxID=105859 RepID=UPI003AF803D9
MAVAGHFVVMIVFWLTRTASWGWGQLFPDGYLSDTTPVLIITFSLFVFPSTLPCLSGGSKAWNPILSWDFVVRKVPWGLFMFIGAGFSMAEATNVSGLSVWIGNQLKVLQGINQILIVLCSSAAIAVITDFINNMSAANIFLPLLVELAVSIRMNPIYIIIPSAMACCYAFMLPIASPVNAIVYSYGALRVKDMVKSGAVLNLICVLVTNISINTLGALIFDVHNFPEWAESAVLPTTFSPMYNSTDISIYP